MARPLKEGIEYFPTDVDIFDDPKLLFVTNKFGDSADLIAVKLLTWIYKQGYKVEWNEEMILLFTARNFKNMDAELVESVVNELMKRDFFSQEIYEKYGVLTSRGIQKRWLYIQKSYKRKAKIEDELNLIPDEETPNKQEETPIKQEETRTKKEFSTQKEKKGKEIKRKEIEKHFFFQKAMKLFCDYTKIRDPDPIVHIEPVISFFDHIPEHLTRTDVESCIYEVFRKLDKSKGIKVEYLTSNLQARITAKWEEKLERLKEPMQKEAMQDRAKEHKDEKHDDNTFWKKKGKEYMDYYESHIDEFTKPEIHDVNGYLKQRNWIMVGSIIEPKLEKENLVED